MFYSQVLAASVGNVVINEVAWMGTTISHTDEWIEFYNATETMIALEGWVLRSTDGTPTINLTGNIAANAYFLLERTNDNTVSAQAADQIYTGALGNSGEHLELLDNTGLLIDNVNSWGNWFAGDNTTKQTMERKNPGILGSDLNNWATSVSVGGTPRAQNRMIVPPLEQTPTPEPPPPFIQNQAQQQNSTTSETNLPPQTNQNSSSTVDNNSRNNDSASTSLPIPPPSAPTDNVSATEDKPSPTPQATQQPEISASKNTSATTAESILRQAQKPVAQTVKQNSKTAPKPKVPEKIQATFSTSIAPSMTSATQTAIELTTSRQLASIGSAKETKNYGWLTALTASLLALLSVGLILLLKKKTG